MLSIPWTSYQLSALVIGARSSSSLKTLNRSRNVWFYFFFSFLLANGCASGKNGFHACFGSSFCVKS